MYKIGVISRLLGIPEHVLRFYEKKGLIAAKRKEDSPTRYYDEFDINRFVMAKRLRGLEFTIEEIKEILGAEASQDEVDYYKLFTQKQYEISDQLTRLENAQKELIRLKDALYFHDLNREDIREAELPELYWYCHMDKKRSQDSFSTDSEANRIITDQIFPAVYMMALVNTCGMMTNPAESEPDYGWGMAFNSEYLYLLPESARAQLIRIPPQRYYVRDCIESKKCILKKDVMLALMEHASITNKKQPEYLLVELLPGGKTSYYFPKM